MSRHGSRLGVLGGTFDPVHLGHLASAEEVARAFALDRVLFVLSARPPHKGGDAHAPIARRMAMLELAVRDRPLLRASDMEARRPGPSYTVDTLRELAREHAGAQLYLIVGIDAWKEVDTWSRPEQILELADVVVTSRPGMDFAAGEVMPPIAARSACWYDQNIGAWVHTSGHRLVAHRIQGVAASSTEIRERVRKGLPIDHLVPPDVARYIRAHHLYV